LIHPIEIFYEWATRFNFTRRRLDTAALLAQWTNARDGHPLSAIPSLPAPPDLLVVVMTYERPEACSRLMARLAAAVEARGAKERVALLVIRDAGACDYEAPRALAVAVAPTLLWLDARERLGKARFWQSYQAALLVAERWRPVRTLFLHDDVDFEPDLLLHADVLWNATADDPRRRALYLFSSDADEPEGRWIHFPRRDMVDKACRLTNWLDLQAFMVDRAFFELLDYRMVPIHANRWRRRPMMSSGVGRQLTLRLRGRGTIYQAWPPLVAHGAEPSLANPEARGENDLDNRTEFARAVAARAAALGSAANPARR
jgi:hypothetical protein